MKISIKTLIVAFLFGLIISCESNSNTENNQSKSKIEYDGFVETNSMAPKAFIGKYYFNLRINFESNNQFTVNEKKVKLEALSEEVDAKWKVIEKDGYKAFLNLSLNSFSSGEPSNFDLYLKVYELLENFKRNKKEEYSKGRFNMEYLNLDKMNKMEVDKQILIHIVDAPQFNWK